MTIQEMYEQSIKPLPAPDRFRLALLESVPEGRGNPAPTKVSAVGAGFPRPSLPFWNRFLILNEIPQRALVDYSDEWSDEDLRDLTKASLERFYDSEEAEEP